MVVVSWGASARAFRVKGFKRRAGSYSCGVSLRIPFSQLISLLFVKPGRLGHSLALVPALVATCAGLSRAPVVRWAQAAGLAIR